MSESNRGNRIALGVAYLVLLVIACGAVTGLILDRYADVHKAYSKYQESAEYDRRATQDAITNSCMDADIARAAKCFGEKVEAYYQKQETNKDLQAQQDMAFWAKWLFILGIAQALLSGAGIYLVARSVQQTGETLKLSSSTLHVENRPWLNFQIKVVSPLVRSNRGYSFGVSIAVKNIGKSPARNVKAFADDVYPFDGIDPEEWDVNFETHRRTTRERYIYDEPSGATIFPNEKLDFEIEVWLAEKTISRAAKSFESMHVIGFPSWIVVQVFYESSFQKTRLETSSAFILMQRHGRNQATTLKIDLRPNSKAIPANRILLINAHDKKRAT